MEEIKTLAEQTTDKLIYYIKENNLTVGDKLPNEYELSDYLAVGRSTVREAVRALVSRNILEVRQGAGTFISERKGIATDPLGFSLIKDQDQMIRDLFELRYLLEPKMAALAAKNATDEQIFYLLELATKIEKSFYKGNQEHVQWDIEFHKVIAEASGNVALSHIMPIINESIALFNKNYNSEELKIETVELHKEIVEAIRERDEIAALDAMTVHMLSNRREVRKIIKKNK
ncbi:MAG: FadR/GntR family transcriptional regulator [Enterococcus sp.]